MSTTITGAFTVAQGQTLSLSGADLDDLLFAAFLMVDGAAAPSFVDQGIVNLASTRLDIMAVGIREVSNAAAATGSVTIAQGASFSVSTSDFRASVIGFSDGVAFENDGAFSVSTSQGSLGGPGGIIQGVALAQAVPDFPSVPESFVNTGMLTVDGGVLGTAVIGSAGAYRNAGTIHVQSIRANAVSVSVLAGGATIDNSGSIVAVDNTHSGLGTIGIAVSGIREEGTLQDWIANAAVIANSGSIQADYAVETFDTFGARILVLNSGTLDGDVRLGVGAPESLGQVGGSQIRNSGVIHGAVTLEVRGDDLYDGRDGTLSGPLHFGGGIDRVLLGNDGEVVAGQSDASLAAGLVGTLLARGGEGADIITGGGGNDTIDGGGGADILDGAGGINTVSFASAGAGVTVSLALQGQAQNTVGAGTDTLTHFQNLVGSAFDDTLDGGAGSNSLDGGGGLNMAAYDGAYRQYAVATGGATVAGGPEGGTDTLANIQRIQFVDGYLATGVTDTAAEVYRLYEGALNRGPDPVGLAGWTHDLNAGASLQSAADGFVNSAEFRQTYGALDNTGFVTLLYHNVLHRDPDPGGLAGWLGYLGQGHTRAEAVLGFTQSAEDIADLSTPVQAGLWIQDGAAAEVARLYDTVLGRLPDATGLVGWTHALGSGASLQSVADGFINSAEFQTAFGSLDNPGFLTQLYRNVLHRDPDAEGLAGWLGYLGQGHSRAEVVLGFSESGEHVADTAPRIDHGIWLVG